MTLIRMIKLTFRQTLSLQRISFIDFPEIDALISGQGVICLMLMHNASQQSMRSWSNENNSLINPPNVVVFHFIFVTNTTIIK